MTLDHDTLTLKEGTSAVLTASVEPSTVQESVRWSSDLPDFVSVDQNGKVTAHMLVTTATITALCGGKYAQCRVKVIEDDTF